MKDKILAALKTKYSNLGFGEKAINGVADYLVGSITEESQIETSIAGVENLLKSFQGDTDRIRTEKSDLQKQLDELKAKGTGDAPIKDETKDDDTSTVIKDLLGAVKILTDEVNTIKSGKITDSRKQRYEAIIVNLSDDQKKPYQRTSIDSLTNEAFETLVTDVTAEVGVIEAAEKGRKSVFTPPLGGGGDAKTVSQDVKDRIEARKNEHVPTTIQGLPAEQ